MSEHKLRQRQRQSAERLLRVQQLGERLLSSVHRPIDGLCGSAADVRIDWDSLPASVDPVRGGQVSAERGQRKRYQIESFRIILDAIVGEESLRIVDFCSGSGNFGLALAALLPKCSFLLLDRNAHAIDLSRQRAADAGLQNVSVATGNGIAIGDRPRRGSTLAETRSPLLISREVESRIFHSRGLCGHL